MLMMKVSVPRIITTLKMTLIVTFKTERKRKISLQKGLGGTTVVPIIPQSLEVFPL